MAIEYVKHVSAVTDNLTLTDLLAGDYVLYFAYRYDSSNAMPSGTAAWTLIDSTSNGAQRIGIYEHVVDVAGDVTSNFIWAGITPMTVVVAIAFRGVLSRADLDADIGTGSIITYGDLVLPASDGSTWVAAFLGHKSTLPDKTTPVSDLTLINSGSRHAINVGPRAAWEGETIDYGGSTSLAWISVSVAIEADAAPAPAPLRLRMPMLLGSL